MRVHRKKGMRREGEDWKVPDGSRKMKCVVPSGNLFGPNVLQIVLSHALLDFRISTCVSHAQFGIGNSPANQIG